MGPSGPVRMGRRRGSLRPIVHPPPDTTCTIHRGPMTAPRSLRTRIAGQRAMREVVEAEALARPRTRLERMLGIRALSGDARRAYDVALGDAVVGAALEQLGQRWDVLHDVPIGPRRTIDHLVIGPGGVWAIRAVHCGDADVAWKLLEHVGMLLHGKP